MTLSQTYRTALNTIAGFLLTAGAFSHSSGRSGELPSRGTRPSCLRCVGRWIKLVESDSTASSQGTPCGRRAEPIDLAG